MNPDFYILPKAMYDLDIIKIILANGNNSILFKRLDKSILNMEKIIVSHAILYIKSGRVEIETFDYEKLTAKEGEMLFLPRDSYLMSDYTKDDQEMEVYLFFFDHTLTLEFLQNAPNKENTSQENILKLKLSNNILNYIAALQDMSYKNINNYQLLKIKIFELLHLISEVNGEFIDILQKQESGKTDIETYMLKHFNKNLDVRDWASLSGYSLSTFNRKFKKKHNMSPKKWITQRKMELASESLKKGVSVSECAMDFGYSNTSNFIKAFKEIYKTTPKQYTMT